MSFRSIFLLLGAFHGLVTAGILLFSGHNRKANLFLALLLIAFVMSLAPQILGFAGFYHHFPWFSFFPFNITLAYGPLVYLYLFCLIHGGAMPSRGLWHLSPALAQFLFYSTLFTMSLETKNWWDDAIHRPIIVPIESVVVLAVTFTYLIRTLRLFNRYQKWLPQAVSDRETYVMTWLKAFITVIMITYGIWSLFELVQLTITPLSYVQVFPMYLVLAALTYYLATMGYRHCKVEYPVFVLNHPDEQSREEIESVQELSSDPNDSELSSFARMVRERVVAEKLYLNPTLTLQELASLMATNTSKLSRAINAELGMNFNEFINRFRVEAVKKVLATSDDQVDILQTAFDCGFNSKTSFNRTFKKLTGETPNVYKNKLEASAKL